MRSELFFIFATTFGPLAIAFFGIPILVQWARRRQWTSVQDFRRKEQDSIPLMGGVLIWPVVLITSLITNHYFDEMTWIIAALPMLVTSLIDDAKQLPAKPKFFAQIFSLALWAYLIYPEQPLLLETLGLNYWAALALSLFWILGMVNAVNMIDGLDGLASGFAIVAGIFVLALTPPFGSAFYTTLAFIFGYGGFLLHNRPPAKIYMGDSGSTFIGFFLATQLAILPPIIESSYYWAIPLFILSYPGCDALLAIFRRLKARQPVSSGDHDHIHHKLRKLGLSIPQTLGVIGVIVLFCGITGVGLTTTTNDASFGVIVGISLIALFSFLIGLFFLENRLALQLTELCHEKLKTLIPMSEPVTEVTEHTFIVQYDLEPYFKDLQSRGLQETVSFLQGFHQFLKFNHQSGNVYLVHNTTIISVEQNHLKSGFSNTQRMMVYRNFLSDHNLLKNDRGVPRGMAVYDQKTSCIKVLARYGLYTSKEPLPFIKRGA